ncbi:L-aspartate oxidase [Saliterribacillus persicus]|uniref:L-aspartate oxidase n=1 Tax=Saliterribacillus persicus TaxID=930114 RepID=A0A368YA75_9BACI|nr:L-aspartate oxidase [Saliterribacillus persicus]RCW77025.1 L-aspartate oxidase [Saliterribacillus persicus]
MRKTDVLIIGSGIAALQLAAHLRTDINVKIITKSKLRMTNSYLAQGGIAAALSAKDHTSKHLTDTLEAGRNHNNIDTVRRILSDAPGLINEMFARGRVFDHDPQGNLLLGMEGAHSVPRIVRSGGDATGKYVSEYLIDNLPPNITVEEDIFVYELLVNTENNRCIGVKGKRKDNSTSLFHANHTILATGGCGQLYSYTSNAETACGDGIALAYRAGAELIDMEFIQFHPTLLYINGETKGLISEAVRGEGAILVTDERLPIMEGVHPSKDLAPRHIVSQTIYNYLKQGQRIYLDISTIKEFTSRFPTISANCAKNGIDLSLGKIPVAPGSHFLMGGVKTDITGRTNIERLYAIGETACTGLHGANRLASNSLLEGLYQGKKLAESLNMFSSKHELYESHEAHTTPSERPMELPNLEEIKASMMERVGIVRNSFLLHTQKNWLEQFKVDQINNLDTYSIEDITKIFMLINASCITDSAIARKESRGGHFRSDYPFEDDKKWLGRSIKQIKHIEREKDHAPV